MIDSESINDIIKYLYEKKGFFTFQELTEELSLLKPNIILNVNDFLSKMRNNNECTIIEDEEKKDIIVISKRHLFLFFAYLNIRLSKIGVSKLTEKQLISRMSWVFPFTNFNICPENIIKFANDFGLISKIPGFYYVFPFADFLSNIFSNREYKNKIINKNSLSNTKYKIAKNVLDNIAYEKNLKIPNIDIYNHYIQRLLKLIKDKRQLYVLKHRTAIDGCRFQTLDEIAEHFEVTRERVRQIESKAFKKIYRQVNEITYNIILYILSEKSKLIYEIENDNYVSLAFYLRILGINYTELSDLSLAIITLNDINNIVKLPDNIEIASDHSKIIKELVNIDNIFFRYEDITFLTDRINTYAIHNAKVSERILLTLKKIGKPAHYSVITEVHNSIFPDDKMIERNVHAILSRGPFGIVWVGIRGIYALQEWGYKKPDVTLKELITNIINTIFSKTHRPVPYTVIMAEVFKQRLITKSSIDITLSMNEDIEHIEGGFFVPKVFEYCNNSLNDDQIDKILRKHVN